MRMPFFTFQVLSFCLAVICMSCGKTASNWHLGGVPSVAAITVKSLDSSNQETVTITGVGFTSGSTVTVNGTTCTNVTVVSATEIECQLPPGLVLADVKVTNPSSDGGQVGTGVLKALAAAEPSGVTVAVNSSTQLTVSWTSGVTNTAGFTLAYQASATAPVNCSTGTVVSKSAVGLSTSYSVAGLSPSTLYAFRVCAVNATDGISQGATGSGTTNPALPPPPTGLTLLANSPTKVTVSWTSGGGSTAGYLIAYLTGTTAPSDCSGSGAATVIPATTVGFPASNYALTTLTANTSYSFRVCAVNSISQISTGSNPSGSVLTPSSGNTFRIFVSARTYKGDGIIFTGIGTLSADYYCNAEGQSKWGGGTEWKAIYSTDVADAKDRLTDGIFVNTKASGNETIASSLASLFPPAGAPTLGAAANYDVNGAPATKSVWTGTDQHGVKAGNCNNWTSKDLGISGSVGYSSSAGTDWIDQGDIQCDQGNFVYCAEY